MEHVAVTVVGPDRPGIVAAIAKALFEAGCNLEDATSTVLRGHFAIVLIVALPDGVDADEIEQRLAEPAAELGMVVSVRAVAHLTTSRGVATDVISVYGADRAGIVYEVTRLLADRSVNILDLNSRVVTSDEGTTYVLVLEVTDATPDLGSELSALASRLGVHVAVHAIETEIL